MEITELILELWSNYGIATDRFFHLRLPAPRPRRRRTPAKPPSHPTRHASAQNRSRAPGFAPNQLSWRSPELDTRPRSSPARHDVAMAEPHARLAAPSPAAPTPVDHFLARPDPPPLHSAPIKRAIAFPARAQECRPCHCRRQARLTVEPHPPPLLGSNRAPERVPLTALHLTGQAPPPFPRRSGATAATNHRRPPAPVEPPPRVAPAPTQGTLR